MSASHAEILSMGSRFIDTVAVMYEPGIDFQRIFDDISVGSCEDANGVDISGLVAGAVLALDTAVTLYAEAAGVTREEALFNLRGRATPATGCG
jgi:hypothetical protein